MPILHQDGKPVTIAFDFDGVLHHHDGTNEPEPNGRPVEGAVEMVRDLAERGYRLVVHTCRAAKGLPHIIGVMDWMERHGFPRLPVVSMKPVAALYVDDRGFRFSGPDSWAALRTFLDRERIPSRWERGPEEPGSEVPPFLPSWVG